MPVRHDIVAMARDLFGRSRTKRAYSKAISGVSATCLGAVADAPATATANMCWPTRI